MSAEATFWAWMMGVKPSSCKLVLLCLADCHNSDNGRCDPSVKFISDFTGLDRKTVPEALKNLEAMGLIYSVKRPGTSTQYLLHIAENPVPPRVKGARKKVVPITRPKQLDLPQKRATPKTGIPENGVARIPPEGYPENGVGGTPKTGYEPTKNLPREPTSVPVATATAARAAPSVDNFSLPDLKAIYSNPDSEAEILNHGVPLLTRSGVEFGSARNFLQMLIKKYGGGRVLDGVLVCLLEQPTEPKSYLQAVLVKMGNPIPRDWIPSDPCMSELGMLGVPDDVIEKARDVFVTWFWEQGIRHTNFPALFVRWCERDWERAEGNKNLYLRRLRASAGFEEPFREAP